MAATASQEKAADRTISAWSGFRSGLWRKEIDVRDFIQQNYAPYEGNESFLAPATDRTHRIWNRLNELFVEERKKGVLDVSQIPSSITAHAPGYIDREHEIIVGLQTDAPLKRAIMPNGGFRLVAGALKTVRVRARSAGRRSLHEVSQDAQRRRLRRLHGGSSQMPQLARADRATRRIRPGADHRRLPSRPPLRVTRLIERKQQEKRDLDGLPSTEDIIRDREELADESVRCRNSGRWLKTTGSTFRSGAHGEGSGAVASIGVSRGRERANGAAMSLGRTSTFLDIYFERDLASGTLTEAAAQEIIDDFVIKLRIVRFLRTPEYDELFAGDPTWVTESIAGMGDDGRPLVTKTSFRFLQTLYNLGPARSPNLTIWYSPRLPDGFRRFASKVAIDTSALQFESDEIMRSAWGDDGAIACCVSPMLVGKQMSNWVIWFHHSSCYMGTGRGANSGGAIRQGCTSSIRSSRAVRAGVPGYRLVKYSLYLFGGETDSTEVKDRGRHAERHRLVNPVETTITADTQLALAA